KAQKRAEEDAKRRETMARLARERQQREQNQAAQRKRAQQGVAATGARTPASAGTKLADVAVRAPVPLPALMTRFEMAPLELQETVFPGDLRGFFLRERAASWWVSNQSDDLVCLPHCRIQRLEYQIRTALRVLGS